MSGAISVPAPRLRVTYRVAQTGLCSCQLCGGVSLGMSPAGQDMGRYAWPAECFRPIRPATVDIFRLARSPTPVREPV